MQIPLKPSPSGRKGYALLVTLVFLGVTLITLGGLMQWTASSSKLASKNNQFLSSESAAEAADEVVIAYMTKDYLSQSINSTNYYASVITNITTASWPVTYNFSDLSGTANKATVASGTYISYLTPLGSQYANLQGFIQPYTISTTATPTGQTYNVPATVTENIQFDTIPIFQFAIFYNLNLEFNSGSALTIAGPVYCNASIWFCGTTTHFSKSVISAQTNYFTANDPFSNTGSPYPGVGVMTAANFTVPPESNQPALTLPIGGTNNSGTSVQNILNLPPAGLGAPNPAYLQASNQQYIFNVADLIVSNSVNGTGGASFYGSDISIYYENSNTPASYLTLIPPDLVYSNTVSHLASNYYSFATNVVFYDYRESDTVQALQINVTNFNTWVTNNVCYFYTNGVLTKPAGGGQAWNTLNTTGSTSKSHPIDSIYVYNSVPLTTAQLPGVRVVNGAQLPSSYGLTIATPDPLYVLGNYNVQTNFANSDVGMQDTAYTYPSALMADAITILSPAWQDIGTYNTVTHTTTGSRVATTTTVNAACLVGIVPTNPTITSTGSGNPGDYSGGVANYLRFLEDWGSGTTPMWYNGSMICMYTSQYATNYFRYSPDANTYYTQPTRDWAFDSNFTNALKLPPLTPSVKVMIRTPGGWSAN
jgi:hypothetical protein